MLQQQTKHLKHVINSKLRDIVQIKAEVVDESLLFWLFDSFFKLKAVSKNQDGNLIVLHIVRDCC